MTAQAPRAAAVVGARRASSDILIQIGGGVVNVALGVGVTILLIRSLGDSAFGQWSTLLAVAQLFGYLAVQGFVPAAVRLAATDVDAEGQWIGAALVLRLALALPAAILAAVAAAILANGHGPKLAGVLLASMIFFSSPSAVGMVFQLRVRNWVNVAVTSANSVFWAVAVVALVLLGRATLIWYALAMLTVSCLTAGLQAAWGLHELRVRRPTDEQVRRVARIGFGLGFGALLTLLYGKVDQVIVYRIAGSAPAGLYASAYRILDQAQLVPIAITTTLLPIMSSAHATDVVKFRRVVQVTFEYLMIASLPAFAVSAAAGPQIMSFLFGKEFAHAGSALVPLMGAFVVICFGYLLGQLVIVLESQKLQIYVALGALAVNVALNLALVPRFGFTAAAWITLATEIFVSLVTARFVLARIGLRLEFGRVMRAAVCAAATVASAAGVRELGAGAIVICAAGLVTYVLALVTLRVVTRSDLTVLRSRGAAAVE